MSVSASSEAGLGRWPISLQPPCRRPFDSSSAALAPARRKVGAVRVLLVVGLAALWFGVASSLAAAGPIFTDWSAPVNLGSVVNSSSMDYGPALSADGLSLFFASDRQGPVGNTDIWVTQRATATAAWGAPVRLGATINTSATEGVPSLSTDGHWMFFASNRPGGFGGDDLYQTYRADIHDDFGWQAPTNLGPNVNTPANENGNGYFDNGGSPQLLFGSNKPGGEGGVDLYSSSLQPDGSWGPATPISELNSTADDNRPNLRQDGLEIFFYSSRTGGFGGNDLWTATRASVDAPWSAPVNLGSTVNTTFIDTHPSLSADGTMLIFGSNRPGGFGDRDLYMITRTQILPTTKDDCKQDGWQYFGVFKNQGDCVSFVATDGGNTPA